MWEEEEEEIEEDRREDRKESKERSREREREERRRDGDKGTIEGKRVKPVEEEGGKREKDRAPESEF